MNMLVMPCLLYEYVDKFCYLGDMLSVDGDADAAVEARIRNVSEMTYFLSRQVKPQINPSLAKINKTCVKQKMIAAEFRCRVRLHVS